MVMASSFISSGKRLISTTESEEKRNPSFLYAEFAAKYFSISCCEIVIPATYASEFSGVIKKSKDGFSVIGF